MQMPEWVQNQNQPHVTINTALRILDALAQLVIVDRDLTEPPTSLNEGECFIPAADATGDWEGHDDDIAIVIGAAWYFVSPKSGWRAWILDEATEVRFDDSSSGGWS